MTKLKPLGWNAVNTSCEWWHEFDHEEKNAIDYNWSIVDNNIADEDLMPPVWLPVTMANGFVHDAISCKGSGVEVDMSGNGVDCLKLYDTKGFCCDGHEWKPAIDIGAVYGNCTNPKCPNDKGGIHHGIDSFCAETMTEWVAVVENFTHRDKCDTLE